ncbi:MAG: Ycf51 family protein [Cyanobacteria bacterium P01_D01_bin.73]
MDFSSLDVTALSLEGAKYLGLFDLACAAFTVLAFVFGWGFRFRMVGITAFTGVLTAGLFGFGIAFFQRPIIDGAARYSLVYDTGGVEAVIAVAPDLDDETIDATLRQAALDLYSPGRLGGAVAPLVVRVRTIKHLDDEVSEPTYLGEISRSLTSRIDENPTVTLYAN